MQSGGGRHIENHPEHPQELLRVVVILTMIGCDSEDLGGVMPYV